ncbi:MAG: diguanylate cyclase [Treponema sp.]|jgi:diguanylate cyclase (GGDEF)-like protein|nr:diguanylate cyclase [Treponema sp.]
MVKVMDGEQKNTLLIVDDEKSNLKLLTHILGTEYTIYTATNGENAIEKAKEYVPDLILLDIVMPGMDGYETLSELRKYPKTQKIPVVFITGLSSSEDEEKGLSLEAADYISKPFSAMIVKLRVRNQIQMVNQLRTIERLSRIDQLTDIPNRRSFDERLHIEWNHALREQTPISILILDVDKFKNYNDTYGHQNGDIALQTVAKIISHLPRRSTDFAARWGGEEFVILLSNTPLAPALNIAEKIRADIENEKIPCTGNTTTKVTASIGVNTQVPAQADSIDAFISSADKALYAAKEAGRNRVIASQ